MRQANCQTKEIYKMTSNNASADGRQTWRPKHRGRQSRLRFIRFSTHDLGAVFGTNFMVSPGGVILPKLSSNVPQESLGIIFIVAGILALIFPFISESLGGMSGAKTGRQWPICVQAVFCSQG
jgi:hypothetical protein